MCLCVLVVSSLFIPSAPIQPNHLRSVSQYNQSIYHICPTKTSSFFSSLSQYVPFITCLSINTLLTFSGPVIPVYLPFPSQYHQFTDPFNPSPTSFHPNKNHSKWTHVNSVLFHLLKQFNNVSMITRMCVKNISFLHVYILLAPGSEASLRPIFLFKSSKDPSNT